VLRAIQQQEKKDATNTRTKVCYYTPSPPSSHHLTSSPSSLHHHPHHQSHLHPQHFHSHLSSNINLQEWIGAPVDPNDPRNTNVVHLMRRNVVDLRDGLAFSTEPHELLLLVRYKNIT
jgi:hypothetical protein